MNKIFTFLMLAVAGISVKAQTQPANLTQPFGKIDKADLEMTSCDFEKDANAEVLFNTGELYYDASFNININYHKRIKIFNDNGKKEADIHIPFYVGNRKEYVGSLQAETINLTDGKIEITKLDKKQIFLQHLDKNRDEYIFSMPNVKAGSVIEYKYQWGSFSVEDFPDWYFQEKIPVRYSELNTEIPEMFHFKTDVRMREPFFKNTSSTVGKVLGTGDNSVPYNNEQQVRAMANVKSLPDEPYMSSYADNLQGLIFQLTAFKMPRGIQTSFNDTWPKIGGSLAEDDGFGGQLKRKLNNEEEIIAKAGALKTYSEKIAYIFNEVKNTVKWNGIDRWYTNDGTSRAWEIKSGNSTEVNLILYHLLKKSGINAFPMVVSTREHGKVNPYYPNLYQFNRAVVYIKIDSATRYVLDATNKYNIYSETPANLLNSSGLYIDKDNKTYDIVFLRKTTPVKQVILINAEIKPDGKMNGTVQENNFSYNRVNAVKKYKTDGEEKYINYLRNADNNLKITDLKFDNMEVDTLPLTQNMNFSLDLTGSDDNYIYFKPNIFTSDYDNAFLSEKRFTDIDFSYRNYSNVNGVYKMPAGYKIDAMPKSVSMSMPDNSITFRRVVAEQDGSIVVRYTLDYKQSIYFKENYPEFHEFFKKLNEMLNEQIVLKKS